MSVPIALPADLATYLGVDLATMDTVRATQSLQLAQDLCETIWSPIGATALGTVLAVASRQFVNVSSAASVALGTGHIAYGAPGASQGVGGLYLSRSDKTTLRRLAGRGGGFSVDVLPTGASAVLSVTVVATAGTYTLNFAGAITAPIVWNATAGAVQAALEALGVIGVGNVSVTGAYLITFTGTLATVPVPPLVADGGSLTGTVTTAVVTPGVLAPGQGLPPWDYDYYRNRHSLGQQVYGGQW
ncbi:MAG: hypothetical protein M0Z51_16730 [Propionibacterium sp.]|nr:hypothetical protein [Propionibacterium sp.]